MTTFDEFLRGAISDVIEARWYPPPVDCPGGGVIPCLNPPAADGGPCSECVGQEERRVARGESIEG